MQDFEKLGVFYLGAQYDLERRKRGEDLILYDAKDLVTHAVCVGMTGSGKTGLCISLLEEAAIDHIPAIVIDPKGDLSNLLLTFPNLAPADFAPWINEDDARRKGIAPAEFAAQQAALWQRGLAEWGQDGARIQKLREAAEFAVYTPGSNAGLSVSVLKSFSPPPMEIIEDTELFRERIASTVTSLLGLLNIEADPLQSREHILLSTLFGNAWAGGQDLDLPSLIHAIQTPGITRVGVMELETFYPSKDRFALAMQLNNLIASPGFSRWTDGEPLDIGSLLYTPTGKPRIAIFSIAHLNDAERMFFVSLLLNQMLGWVRTQSGTTSLRALLYMDEIAGYFPPVANPPSKQPLLTLMKQARAFGVGIVLATQNPVDIDYKGLSNAGTWFIGRLQTERDKARVLDGLEGAAAGASSGFDRASVDGILSQLGNRIFLMNNVHESGPVIFETRWAMSYLRGPLTRNQIKTLTDGQRAGLTATTSSTAPVASASAAPNGPARSSTVAAAPANGGSNQKPILPPEIPQYFIPVRSAPGNGSRLLYEPVLLATGRIYYSDAKLGIDTEETVTYWTPVANGPVAVDWDVADEADVSESEVETEPAGGAAFAALPAEAGKAKSYDAWKKSFADMLYRARKLELRRAAAFKEMSRIGESEREFRLRIMQAVREARDAQVEKLRGKYAAKFSTLQERKRRAQQAEEVQKEQARDAKVNTAISFGSAILGALFGRKVTSAGNIGKAGTAIKGVGRSIKESSDIGRAAENVAAVDSQIAQLEAQLQSEADAIAAGPNPLTSELETVSLKPKKTNISVRAVLLAWAPHAVDGAGNKQPLWQ